MPAEVVQVCVSVIYFTCWRDYQGLDLYQSQIGRNWETSELAQTRSFRVFENMTLPSVQKYGRK